MAGFWGVPPSLKGFFPGDDGQDLNAYTLVALNTAPAVTTDLLWMNKGTTGPITPTNFTAKIVSLWLNNPTATAGKVQIFSLNTVAASSAFTPVAEFTLAANTAFQVSTDNFRVLAPPNCKFQVVSAFSGDVIATARYLKGAGQ